MTFRLKIVKHWVDISIMRMCVQCLCVRHYVILPCLPIMHITTVSVLCCAVREGGVGWWGGWWGVRPGRVVCGNTRFTACLSRDSTKKMLFSFDAINLIILFIWSLLFSTYMLLTIQMVVLMITAAYAYIYYIIILVLGCLLFRN